MDSDKIDYIAELEDLNKQVPSLEDIVYQMASHYALYSTDSGKVIPGEFIAKDNDCAILKIFSAGSIIFPIHMHDEYEYCIVIEGIGTVTIKGVKTPFKPYDCITFDPGTEHSWYFESDTKLLVITIPPSKGFPSGKG